MDIPKIETIIEKSKIHPSRIFNIYLFGSVVYGTADKNSDYDVIMIANNSVESTEIRNGLFNIHIYTPDKFMEDLQWHRINNLECIYAPDWAKLKVDARGMKILAKILLRKTLGDDQLLRTLRSELEADGFELKGIQDYVPNLLAPTGLLTAVKPLDEDNENIRLGFNAAKELGRQDKGQSVVVQQETVLGLEGPDGTKALMLKAAQIKSSRNWFRC